NLLNRDGLLVDHDALLGEGDRRLLIVEFATTVGSCGTRVDRSALHADLFTLNRDLDGLGVVNDVLAQTYLASADTLLVHIETLLGAGDGVTVSVGCGIDGISGIDTVAVM